MPEPTPASRNSARPAGMALLRWGVAVTAVFAVVALASGWVSKSVAIPSPVTTEAPPEAATGAAGAQQADFRLATLEGGRQLGPPDFAGDLVVIDFWASWCAPCRLQAKFLEQLHEETAGEGVKFLAVNAGESAETVRKYVEKTPFPYPVLLDPEDSLSARYRLFGLPTVMIVDRSGAVSFLETGVSDTDRLRQALAAADS